ncbi:bone morphogenetic protein 10-like [Nerophis ophidion]|uniref:bone morphogenetic protein 10-like n=1 Tax=Nerophis ophidion TaxID=159077 RepID=UPI002ADF57FE|nr:bone morphogenetic protein 10-like [Nerophis ophidion]
MTLTVVSGLGSILSLSVLLVVSSGGPVGLDGSLLDAKDFLSHFLATLNVTGQKTPGRALSAPKEPPEYMLELYQRFANDQSAVPSANVVRSFKNEGMSRNGVTFRGVRTHLLLFNISVPHHEDITRAELRLFTLVRRSQRPYLACKVTIYKVHGGVIWTREVGKTVRRRDQEEEEEEEHLEELLTKHIVAEDSSWVSFDLTHAVELRREFGYATLMLEVHIAIFGSEEAVTRDGEVLIDTEGQHNAVMVVFSDDPGKRHERRGNDLPDRQLIRDTPHRLRRNVKSEACKRTPLFVDFKDIGWDTWIIQPVGYEAYTCNGVCGAPLTPEVSPTKHAIVQTLLSVKSPERASRACCVPTKLEPISLLYHDNGVITFNHKYEGMVVAECGCR